jgi:hypothetical protein
MRSPRQTLGRSGVSGVHEIGMADLLADSPTAEQLVQRLREEVGV